MRLCLARNRCSVQISLVVLGLSFVTIGCGGSGAKGKGSTSTRVKATGKVEIDGKPVPAGSIAFYSLTTGNTGGGEIKNGIYTVDAAQGPNPGDNSVIIVGKEKADGEEVWQWSKQKVTVADGGFKEDFSIKMPDTQKPHKRIIDN